MREAFYILKEKLSWQNLNLLSLLHRYRYLSLAITSAFYFTGPPGAPFYLKLGVVLCLCVEAHVFVRVYRENQREVAKKALIVIKLVGLLFVLALTGGMESPFLWYAINPILLSATLVPFYFCWSVAAGFISAAIYSQQYVAHHPDFLQFSWHEHAHVVLIFILLVLAAQLYHYLFSKLSRQSALMEQQLEHIKSLYEVMEVFSHHSDPQEAVNLFASYCKRLTGAAKVIIWTEVKLGDKGPPRNIYYAVRGPRHVLLKEHWYPYLKKLFADKDNGWKVVQTAFNGEAEEAEEAKEAGKAGEAGGSLVTG